ncbi:MAG: hypothetical protein GXY85_02960 [Candidatus Brocadiaceae bacterium]|nr:hypothetical protein [Candidatus Brocadiaceae bacterium]
MSAVTKTLVVLVFVFSLTFAVTQVMLYNKRTNYSEAYRNADTALRTAQAGQTKAEAELKETRELLETSKARLESENERLLGEKRDADVQVKELRQLTGEMNTTIQTRDGRITALEGDIATRDASIKQLHETVAQRDAAIQANLARIAELDATVAARDATIGQLEHDLTQTKITLQETSASEEQLLAMIQELRRRNVAIPPISLPIVNGRVVRVDPDYMIAVVDKGKDAGVKPNTTFTLYRDDQYLARLIIQEVQKDASVGQIQLIAEGMTIREGDRATTQIP